MEEISLLGKRSAESIYAAFILLPKHQEHSVAAR